MAIAKSVKHRLKIGRINLGLCLSISAPNVFIKAVTSNKSVRFDLFFIWLNDSFALVSPTSNNIKLFDRFDKGLRLLLITKIKTLLFREEFVSLHQEVHMDL